MRPKVVAKIMTKELILFGLALMAAIGMPLYFFKIKNIKEKYSNDEQTKMLNKQEEEMISRQQKYRQ